MKEFVRHDSRVAAKELSHGQRPWVAIPLSAEPRNGAKESFAATRLIRTGTQEPRPSAVATFLRRYAAQPREEI